jgi:hypothetical protein
VPSPTSPPPTIKFYHYRREVVSRCRPNAAHYALAAFERRTAQEGRVVSLMTQNVDGLHLVMTGVAGVCACSTVSRFAHVALVFTMSISSVAMFQSDRAGIEATCAATIWLLCPKGTGQRKCRAGGGAACVAACAALQWGSSRPEGGFRRQPAVEQARRQPLWRRTRGSTSSEGARA